MENFRSFELGAVLRPTMHDKSNAKTHKSRPTQFGSVADGTYQRLQKNIKERKSSRLTTFDSKRNLPAEDPAPVADPKLAKVEHRRQQLEKWKEEKEKRKREAAAQKKKPFVTGVAHAPLKFVPPPPPPKPSTSGRITRSQASRTKEIHSIQRATTSFAPKNAPFRPPELKNVPLLSKFATATKIKTKEQVTFDPVQPKNTVRQTRSKTVYSRPVVTEVKSKTQNDTKSAIGKQVRVANRLYNKTNQITSSSSSDLEPTTKTIKRVQTPAVRKSDSKKKSLTPKHLVLSSETSSSEEKEKPTTATLRRRSSRKSVISINDSSDSNESKSSLDEPNVQAKLTNRSTPKILLNDCSVVIETSPLIKAKTDMRTPKPNIPKSESSSEEKLRSPKTPNGSPLTPEQIELAKSSPCVTLSRGKDKARRETLWKINEGLLDDDVVENDGVDFFRQQLASEVARITSRCELWDKISEQNNLPDSVQELVLAAVGQARLLVSKKMQQFAALVDSAAAPQPGASLVTTADLQGFWDMVYMQVVNIDMRFKKLEELRERNWVEEQAPVVKAATRASPAKRAAKKSTAKSRLKDVIAAARKAKKQKESTTITDPSTPGADREAPNEKTFEAGFFTVRSPVQSPVRTPCKQTLLKAVLSSEAKKTASRNSASFAMLRASILGKNAEFEGVAPLPQTPQITPINLNATPARSILKSGNVPSTTKSNKSIKLVLFDNTNESDTSATSEETNTAREVNFEETLVNQEEMQSEIKEVKAKDAEINKTKKNLTRQDALDISSTPNRSKRKSNQTPKTVSESENESVPTRMSLRPRPVKSPEMKIESNKTPKRSSKKKALQESPEVNIEANKTPRRSGKKEVLQDISEVQIEVSKTPKRSGKKKALQEIEINVMDELMPTPKRSLRSRKSAGSHNTVK